MRAQFVRGAEPIDSMSLGDVIGRRMKVAYKQLREAIEKIAVEEWGDPEILKHEDNPYMKIKELKQKLFIEVGIERKEGESTYFYYLVYVPEPDPDNGGANWAAGYKTHHKSKWPTSPNAPAEEGDEIPYDNLEDAINKMKWWIKNL
jgi:hypothetical protein